MVTLDALKDGLIGRRVCSPGVLKFGFDNDGWRRLYELTFNDRPIESLRFSFLWGNHHVKCGILKPRALSNEVDENRWELDDVCFF